MNREDFIDALSQGSDSPVETQVLASLLEEHPYSQAVHFAWAKSLARQKDVRLADALEKTAVQLSDRVRFHEEINNWGSDLESVQVKELISEQEVHTSQDEAENQPIESDKSFDKEKLEESDNSADSLEAGYLASAMESSLELEIREEVKEVQFKQPEKTSAPYSEQKELGTFLDFISGGVPLPKSESEQEVSVNSVVENFLGGKKNEKVAFFSAERMAKKSLDDDEGLVSDTLARIYLSQGNYRKAIETYERLQLKYPQKSDYFAGRIEKIQDEQRIKKK